MKNVKSVLRITYDFGNVNSSLPDPEDSYLSEIWKHGILAGFRAWRNRAENIDYSLAHLISG